MKTIRQAMFAAILIGMGALTTACAQDPLAKLAQKLERGISKENEGVRVAVLGFPYLDAKMTKGTTIIQERITTCLAESGRVTVIERTLLDKVLAEAEKNYKDGITPEALKRMGAQYGVDVVVTGTLNDLAGGKTEINARAVHTQTAKVIAAGRAVVKRTWDSTPLPRPVVVCPGPQPRCPRRPVMQIALLLDTSNSMDGLINQAKTQLWRIVNELACGRRGGMTPVIYVALYEYGNNRLDPESGYIRQVLPFTADLDEVSRQLFSLTTCGGSEYCGQVIERSLGELSWCGDDDAYKAIFIAGNEPFTQGPVYYEKAARGAARRGIAVNAIFCGNYQEGMATCWKNGADLGRGEYMSIDHNADIVCTRSPYDDEITRLGMEMNSTFIAYGSQGAASKENQITMDALALADARSGAAVERMQYKAKSVYAEAASWDLVNQARKNGIHGLSLEQMPAELRNKSDKELEALVSAKERERARLQAKIGELEKKRREYLTKASSAPAANSLDAAVLKAVTKQAKEKKFEFSAK